MVSSVSLSVNLGKKAHTDFSCNTTIPFYSMPFSVFPNNIKKKQTKIQNLLAVHCADPRLIVAHDNGKDDYASLYKRLKREN